MTDEEVQKIKRIIESPNKELTGAVLAEMSISVPAAHGVLRKIALQGGVVEAFDYVLKCWSDHLADKLIGYENWIDPGYPVQDYSDSKTS